MAIAKRGFVAHRSHRGVNDEKDNEEPWREDRQRHQTCRATRKHHSYEEKIRIVLDGLRGEDKEQEFLRFGRSGACLDSKQTLGQSPPYFPSFQTSAAIQKLNTWATEPN